MACTCREWSAVEDRMPPRSKAQLQIHGKMLCGTRGHSIEVQRSPRQASDAAELVLELVVSPKSGFFPQVPGEVEFHYTEDVTKGQYTKVTLIPDCGTKAIEVVE